MKPTRKLIAYYRVSTKRQGESGLGLEGQKTAVLDHAARHNDVLIGDGFTEIESGRRSDRPELARALDECRRANATLIVAKLDRLTRNMAFWQTLKTYGINIAFCELPQFDGPMGSFVVDIMVLVAQLEASLISQRTKAALAEYRSKGRVSRRVRELYPGGVPADVVAATAGKLGGQLAQCRKLTQADRKRGVERRVASVKAAVAEREGMFRGFAVERRATGQTLAAIAAEMNGRGYVTRTGKAWSAVAVLRLLNKPSS
jgi:DNA invertase Pin-like site-specific DNA recombinase